LGPLKDWGLDIDKNQFVVDPPTFETNRRGIFAVGDGCVYPGKLKLIATGVGEAVSAICVAKTRLDPTAKLFPGHSSDLDL
jgi:thioredoxin reductase (NADPH)